jgi:hypothetical protein
MNYFFARIPFWLKDKRLSMMNGRNGNTWNFMQLIKLRVKVEILGGKSGFI